MIVTDEPTDHTEAESEQFITSFGTLDSKKAFDITTVLADQILMHALTPSSVHIYNSNTTNTMVKPARYDSSVFYGIMVDTGASKKSTAGYRQYIAYKDSNTGASIELDISTAGAVNVQFGIGSMASIGSIIVNTPVRGAEFHIVKADIPFLLCLKDIDKLEVYYNNLKDVLMTPSGTIPVHRRFGHPFIL